MCRCACWPLGFADLPSYYSVCPSSPVYSQAHVSDLLIGPLYAISLAVNLSAREGTRKQLYRESHGPSSAPQTNPRSPASKMQPRSPRSMHESGERLNIRSHQSVSIALDPERGQAADEKPHGL